MGDTAESFSQSANYKRVKGFLEKDQFDGFTADDLFIIQFVKRGWGQDIAALSNMAEALMNAAHSQMVPEKVARNLLVAVVSRALHRTVSPYKKDPQMVTNFGRHGYYLEHLNIILGCYQSVVDDEYFKLNERITQYLVRVSLSETNFHAPLLPNVRMRWSADQAAIIYSIWLFDQNNDTSLHESLRDEWLNYMQIYMRDPRSGLLLTEVMGVKRYSKQPRGCALAYLIYFTNHFAPKVAREQWILFKNNMLIKRLGVSGFREYLPDYRGGWTPDSGPVIAGIGIGASGLGLKTASCMSDIETYNRLNSCISPVMKLMRGLMYVPLVGRLARLGTDLLATSIKLCAETRLIIVKRTNGVR